MEKFYTANPYNVLSVDKELEDKVRFNINNNK